MCIRDRVTATPTKTDSGWQVTGTISLGNPNSVPVNGITVVDSMPGAICNLTSAAPTTLAAQASADVTYLCTYTSDPGTGALTNR